MTTGEDWDEGVEFECPQCWSDCFGTHSFDTGGNLLPFEKSTGYCTGVCEDPCGFEWPRSDDWKYFKIVRTRSFKSQEEYKAYETKI